MKTTLGGIYIMVIVGFLSATGSKEPELSVTQFDNPTACYIHKQHSPSVAATCNLTGVNKSYWDPNVQFVMRPMNFVLCEVNIHSFQSIIFHNHTLCVVYGVKGHDLNTFTFFVKTLAELRFSRSYLQIRMNSAKDVGVFVESPHVSRYPAIDRNLTTLLMTYNGKPVEIKSRIINRIAIDPAATRHVMQFCIFGLSKPFVISYSVWHNDERVVHSATTDNVKDTQCLFLLVKPELLNLSVDSNGVDFHYEETSRCKRQGRVDVTFTDRDGIVEPYQLCLYFASFMSLTIPIFLSVGLGLSSVKARLGTLWGNLAAKMRTKHTIKHVQYRRGFPDMHEDYQSGGKSTQL